MIIGLDGVGHLLQITIQAGLIILINHNFKIDIVMDISLMKTRELEKLMKLEGNNKNSKQLMKLKRNY